MTFRAATLAFIAVCLNGFHAVVWAADLDELSDLAARAQFDYYAGDKRALARDAAALTALHVPESFERTRLYQVAYAQWKLAESLGGSDRSAARRAAESCNDASDTAIAAVPKRGGVARPDVLHAELHAIQAACLAIQDEVLGVSNFYRANKAIDIARGLQPQNARVLLVYATLVAARAKTAEERSSAERALTQAVAAFDAQTALPPGAPDWGHAEALARLGALQLRLENRIAARNATERALVLASDYVWARELLVKITDRK